MFSETNNKNCSVSVVFCTAIH